MAELQITYDAPPTLARFMRSDARVRMCLGPVGSGKSSAGVMEILRRAVEAPVCTDGLRHSRFAVIRNTYPELRDTTRKTFEQWIPDALGEWSETEFIFRIRFDNVDSEVLFRALDRPKDVKKLLSLELTGAYLNEAREIPRAVFDLIQSRTGRFPSQKDLPAGADYWHGVWGDSNPPDEDHWIYRVFEEQRPEGFEMFRQPSGLAPNAENVEHLVDGYYANLIAGKDEDWIKVYVHGDYGFVRDGKPMYPEFQDSLHVAECPMLPKADVVVGNDYGLTPAAIFLQRDPSDGQIQVVREYVSERMGAVDFGREQARLLKTEFRGRPVVGYGDPAGQQSSQVDERTPIDVVRAAGVPIQPAPTNDFMLRREAVAGLLTRLTVRGRPALVIDPACRILRKAMAGGYCLRRMQVAGDERYRDVPDKNAYSHVAEALQYACVGLGEDRRAIHGGQQRKVAVNIRVHRSVRV